jgi:hypothetical protein
VSESQSTASPETAQAKGRPSVILIGVLVIVLVIAFVVGRQLIGVLITVISPPTGPLPDGAVVQVHENESHGVDDWTYSVPLDACTVTQFYIDAGAQCVVSPLQCGAGSNSIAADAALIARCYGQYDVSIFSLRYEAIVGRGEGDGTMLRVVREMLWSGAGSSNTDTTPEATSAP